jgi:hypothetical protein
MTVRTILEAAAGILFGSVAGAAQVTRRPDWPYHLKV